MEPVHVLVLRGPAGVGKTTTAYEIGRLLAARDVPHALIDTDELDRVHPQPPPDSPGAGLAGSNLAAIWGNFAAAGHTRLVLTGVFADVASELPWIAHAVPGAAFTVARLTADESTLADRVLRREVGSGAEEQLVRTARQLETIRRTGRPDTVVVDTTGRSVPEVAREVLAGWPPAQERSAPPPPTPTG
ncbi:hypothetical protein [Actinoalloteichus caeruleus]|uniref:hypothetical protein n=1 Tax=Actinoalloteichus cyanogriseus TaxID=2893586 RepID=UPI00068F184E|nr:hypothetical protein [Actinoalloteichus caeruleus]